jgi:hypothetical protein
LAWRASFTISAVRLFASVIVYVTNVGGQVQRLGIRLAERVQPVAVVVALVVGQDPTPKTFGT